MVRPKRPVCSGQGKDGSRSSGPSAEVLGRVRADLDSLGSVVALSAAQAGKYFSVVERLATLADAAHKVEVDALVEELRRSHAAFEEQVRGTLAGLKLPVTQAGKPNGG